MKKTTLTVNRYLAGSFSNGKWTAGTLDTSFTVSGFLQPISGEDRQNLPQGIRQKAQYKLYLQDGETTLRIVDLSTSKDGDIISYDSRNFRVFQDRDYSFQAKSRISHHRYVLVEEGDR